MAAKRRAGEAAAVRVDDGMVVGLGSGTTAGHAIDALGAEIEAGLDAVGVPTSYQAAERARAAGVPVRSLEDVPGVSIAIDGADQVVDWTLIKGGGAAHTREKLVDAAAEEFVVVIDPSKRADTLSHPVPIEVLPDARRQVSDRVAGLDATVSLRTATAKSGPVVTDNGNLVLDAAFDTIDDPGRLGETLSTIPGVVGHGLFVGLADTIVTGTTDDVSVEER